MGIKRIPFNEVTGMCKPMQLFNAWGGKQLILGQRHKETVRVHRNPLQKLQLRAVVYTYGVEQSGWYCTERAARMGARIEWGHAHSIHPMNNPCTAQRSPCDKCFARYS